MVIFAALFIVLFIAVLCGHVFLHRIKDFLQEDVLRMLRQFSANQNVNGGIIENTVAGEGVEPVTPSTSSPTAGGTEFEVFLSFRGEDTRKGFTGHLLDGLKERGISTFIDSEKLEEGEEINKLFEYIERSKIFLPIFSKRFAESKWCLKEVTKSVECGKEIIPVFFGIEPSDVRNQSSPFKYAFKYHQSNKKQDQEEVRKWRKALEKVGNLSGFTLKGMDGDEAKLKRAVIERVSTILNKKPFEVAKHPIGIETRVHDVKKMLENGGNINGVHVVGIHGMGGLGKTTIAKAVYNDLAQGFNGATCFISNVRENAGQPNGLVNLQKQLIEDTLKEKNTFLRDVAQGKNVIKDRASRKRVLLILDDVDSREQLDALAGGRDWFGSGSVILITTRDEEVLLAHDLKQDEIYKPQELNQDQSGELFILHAFNGGHQPQGEFVNLSNEVVAAAGGLPLTLEVIGLLLSSKKNVQEWKDTLEKLKKIPPKEVQQKLKLSYDSLDDEEKEIFLDIACFFIREKREYATYMWEDCDWFPKFAIHVLVQRSLVKIRAINETDEKYEVFEMHDQIRDMGRTIVDEECSRKLQKKSRLWNNQDSWDLLKKKGPETIDAEGIEISFYENHCTVGAQCFENMPNLRYLNAKNVTFQGMFPCFPTDLKWLQLRRCHFDSPPSQFNLEKLVILDLYNTNMPPILRLKSFERLKVLSIHRVKTEITLDFTNMTSLVTLRFLDCSALTTIDETIGELKNLAHLRIHECAFLWKLPDSIWQLSSLEVLNIKSCFNVSSLPERLGELGSLKKLDISHTRIKKVPDSICRLSSLEMLCLKGCFELRSIPEGLGDMESLKKIDLSNTYNEDRPDSIGPHTNQFEVIPDSIGQLTNLVELSLCRSGKLTELPNSICQLKMLKLLDLKGCVSLCALPERLGDMEKLEELILDSTRIEAIPDSVGRLHNLRLLSLNGCKFIKALPISIRQLSSIQRLEMFGTNLNVAEIDLPAISFTEFTGSASKLLGMCDQTHKALEILYLKDATIEDLPDCVGRMEKLKELRLECEMLKELPNWIEGSLVNLTQLVVRSMHLKALPDCIGSLKQMSKLELKCMNLESLPDSIGELENVDFFIIDSAKLKALQNSIALLGSVKTLELHCMSLEALPDSIGSLKHVHRLTLKCPNLEALPDFARLSSLKWLNLIDCKGLEYLPQLPSSLHSLNASGCTNLRKMPDISNLQNLTNLYLGGCKQLEDVPGLENISSNLGTLYLPGPCDFTGCCHFSHDFKNKVFKEMSFENLNFFTILGSLVSGSAKGQQQLQFIFPRLPFSWLREATLRLRLDKVLSPICIAILADEVTVFEKIVKVKDDHFVRLKLREESIMNIGEGAHCYTMQVTMDVSQLQKVRVLLQSGRWY